MSARPLPGLPPAASGRDRLLSLATRTAALGTASIVALVFLFLALEAAPALDAIGPTRFLTDARWLPGEGGPEGQFGLAPMVGASLAITFGAVLVAAPLGLLAAVFVEFHAPARLAVPLRRLLEVQAGIPSIVFGFWGLVRIVPWIAALRPPGPSLLAGVLVLALMILPTVALLAQATLATTPRAELEGAAALGLSRWTTLRHVVWPSARAGLGVAVLLGALRAVGETMAVLMVCGNVPQLGLDPFAPVRTLTANVALELGYATDAHRAVLFVSGGVLMALVLGLSALRPLLRRGTLRD